MAAAGRRRAAARAPRRAAGPSRAPTSCSAALSVIRGAEHPIVLAGNGVARTGAAAALREFADTTGIGVAETFMGKGDARLRGPARARHRRPAVARLRAGGLRGRRRRDHGRLRPRRARAGELEPDSATSGSSASTPWPPEVDEHFMTEVDLIGDLSHILTRLAEELRRPPPRDRRSRLNDIVLGRFEAAKRRRRVPDAAAARAVGDPPGARAGDDILISDVGLHKLWIARMFPAHEPDTVFIANGLAGMGIALPTGDRRQARPPRPQGRHRQRRRRLPDERAGAGDRGAAAHRGRERDLGEPPVRLDRLEAGQEVRPPLRHRLHEPRLRAPRRRVRHAGVALRGGRGLRPPPAARADARRALADRRSRSTTRSTSSISEELGTETVAA